MKTETVLNLGGKNVTLTICPDEHVRRRYRIIASIGGTQVGYCALKPSKNDFTRGYRITNYVVYSYNGAGIGWEMVCFFEAWIGKPVVPSGMFGATGKLTNAGKAAAIKRLRKTKPTWLPENWEAEAESYSVSL